MTRVLPTGWEKLKVRDVSKIYLGLTHTPQYIDNGIPFLSVKNISAGKIDFKDTKFISKEEFNSLPDGAKPQKGDVLFARVGTLGCPSIVDTEQPFGTFVSLGFFRVNKNKILNTYIRYWMMSPSFWEQVNINVQGSTLKNLNTGWLKNFEINVPSLPEQKRIVEKLDKIFANIDKAKEQTTQNLKNAQEVFESSLDAVLTKEAAKWPEKKLNDVCVVERGSSPRPIKSFITTAPDGVNWIKIGDCSGKYVTSTSQKITPEGAKKSRYVRRGDFIISNSMSYGKPYIMDIDGYIHDGWFVLRLNHSILVADFLYYILSSPFAKRQYDILAAGAIVQNISSDLIKKVKFNLPSISEQKRIVAQLDNLHNKTQELEKVYTQKLVDLDELKQSVLQQAFSGKL